MDILSTFSCLNSHYSVRAKQKKEKKKSYVSGHMQVAYE